MYKTRQEALINNEKYYFTGKPCKKGHISERHVAGGCMMCRKENGKEYRENNKDYIKEWHKQNHKKTYSKEKRRKNYLNNRKNEMFYAARWRAKNKNLDFTITLDDILIPEVCPVFNIPLDSRDRFRAPALDRIDNKLGYIKNNVQVISSKANRLKNNGSLEEFKLIVSYMEKNKL